MNASKSIRREIITFLAATLALSSVFYYLIISAGTPAENSGIFVIGLMWCPGIAALVTRLLFHKSLRGMGWRWGKPRYQIASYLLPIAYALIAYSVVWVSGLGGINQSFSTNYFLFITLGTVASCVTALGEEIGWRGLLVPQLVKLTGFTTATLISGCIWAVWHYPIILFGEYNAGTPVWYGLTCFTLMVLGISFAFNWLRLKSGSLWTAMFLHASHNLYVQGLFDPLTEDRGITKFIIGEFGAALAVTGLVVGYVFWLRRSSLSKALQRVQVRKIALQ